MSPEDTNIENVVKEGEGEKEDLRRRETEVGYRMLSKMSIRPKNVVYDSVKKKTRNKSRRRKGRRATARSAQSGESLGRRGTDDEARHVLQSQQPQVRRE